MYADRGQYKWQVRDGLNENSLSYLDPARTIGFLMAYLLMILFKLQIST